MVPNVPILRGSWNLLNQADSPITEMFRHDSTLCGDQPVGMSQSITCLNELMGLNGIYWDFMGL